MSASRLVFFVQLVVCLWLLTTSAHGQISPAATRTQLRLATVDSSRVRLLLQLSWYHLKSHDPDSALYYAHLALKLSQDSHFESGVVDAGFMNFKTLLVKEDMPAATALLQTTTGGPRVHMLIEFGEHYLFKPGEHPHDLDQAEPYLLEAKKLSYALGSTYWQYESLCVLGKLAFSRGRFESGKQYFMTIITDCQRRHDQVTEARWWSELGIYMPAGNKNSYHDMIYSYQQAVNLYHQLHDGHKEASVLTNLASMYKYYGQWEAAEKSFQQVLTIKKALHEKKIYPVLFYLSGINRSNGNLALALYYGVETIRNMEALDVQVNASACANLGDVYRELGNTAQSLVWYQRALKQDYGRNDFYVYAIADYIVSGLIKQGKAKEALAFLLVFIRKNSPESLNDEEIMASSLGNCYAALGQYAKAEAQYQRMIRLDRQELINRGRELKFGLSIAGSQAHALIAQFYTNQQRYDRARYYAAKALTFKQEDFPLSRRRDLERILFKSDSAAGRLLPAIAHFGQYKALNDSIFSIAKSKQLNELEVQYKTAQTAQNLKLLRNQAQLQQRKLEQSIQLRNFSYAGIALLLLVLGLGWNRYQLKQRSNQLLHRQRQEIQTQNTALQRLVAEKDWLVKEIHHRVKNNLQIVMSLLNTQSAYSTNDEASAAIQESRQRMYAMSLIHQKLYQVDKEGGIDMRAYIPELVDFLASSFSTGHQIRFALHLDPVVVDIAQAVPMGLLLNEAITNAIKYAFPGQHSGLISIELQATETDGLRLSIRDNGVGLPAGFATRTSPTMGLQLMETLAEQLDGTFALHDEGGVAVVVEFEQLRVGLPVAQAAVFSAG